MTTVLQPGLNTQSKLNENLGRLTANLGRLNAILGSLKKAHIIYTDVAYNTAVCSLCSGLF
jgi:hypothetical protein